MRRTEVASVIAMIAALASCSDGARVDATLGDAGARVVVDDTAPPPQPRDPSVPSAPSGTLIVDALTGQPLARTAVTFAGDNGVRCAVAPCPTETSSWTGTTDDSGRVALPPPSPLMQHRLTAVGYANGVDVVESGAGVTIRMPPDFLFALGNTFTDEQSAQLGECIGGAASEATMRKMCVSAVVRNRDGASSLIPRLVELRDDARADVRAAALEALAVIPGAPGVAPSSRSNVRERYLAAVAQTRKQPEVPDDVAKAMLDFVKDAPATEYDAADRIALTFPYRTLLPPLLDILRDGTEVQRDRASHVVYEIITMRDDACVGALGDAATTTLLVQLERGPSTVRARAGMALGSLVGTRPKARAQLEKLAKSKDPDVQDAAARGVRMADDAHR